MSEPPDHSRRVETLSGLGVQRGDIAQILRLTLDDLNQRFSDELKDGPIKANSRVAEELYRKATNDGAQSVTAAIFWMKARAGWKETTRQELGGFGGDPKLTVEYAMVEPDGSRTILGPSGEPKPATGNPIQIITGVPRRTSVDD